MYLAMIMKKKFSTFLSSLIDQQVEEKIDQQVTKCWYSKAATREQQTTVYQLAYLYVTA